MHEDHLELMASIEDPQYGSLSLTIGKRNDFDSVHLLGPREALCATEFI